MLGGKDFLKEDRKPRLTKEAINILDCINRRTYVLTLAKHRWANQMDLPSSIKHALSLWEQHPNISHSYFWFSGRSDCKESACNVGNLGSIPLLGRSSGERNRSPLQYSCLENPYGQRSLVGYSPWGCKESNMTKRLSTARYNIISTPLYFI